MDREYEKAVKRAAKKGRTLPPREDYYMHWGYAYISMAFAAELKSLLVMTVLTQRCSVWTFHISDVYRRSNVRRMGSVRRDRW
jgi:hypothetical protein